MGRLDSIIVSDFVVIEASWFAGYATEFLKQFDPDNQKAVIIHRFHSHYHDLYYLMTGSRKVLMLERFRDAPGGRIEDVLNLHETDANPTHEQKALEKNPALVQGQATVVTHKNRVAGFIPEQTAASSPPSFEVTPGPAQPKNGTRGGSPTTPSEAKPSAPYFAVAAFPGAVKVGQSKTLRVKLAGAGKSLTTAAGNTTAMSLLNLPEGLEVGVVVEPSSEFEPLDEERQTLLTPAPNQESPDVDFELKAKTAGRGIIQIHLFPKGFTSTKMTLEVEVLEASQNPASTRKLEHEEDLQVIRLPDLAISIQQSGSELKFYLNSAEIALAAMPYGVGKVDLKSDSKTYFAQFFANIQQLKLTTQAERELALLRLQGKGAELFKSVLPKELQDWLKAHRNKIKSLLIQSEEPYIPWELCYLEDAALEDGGKFFCELFEVSRWCDTERTQGMVLDLPLKKMALVVPADSGLDASEREADYLKGKAGGSLSVEEIQPEVIALLEAFKQGIYDVFHFVGHGYVDSARADPNNASIELKGGQSFTPDLLFGDAKNLGKAQPIVFLNACQTGLTQLGLTNLGGWAEKFLETGAAAFVGTLWPVNDESAALFCQAFYDGIWAGKNIALAVKEARQAIKGRGDTSWLAYTVFAHPEARHQ